MARSDREALPIRWGGYLLVKRLAVGGMAEVYLAVDEPPLGGRRFVVVKRVREDYADDPEFAQFFLTEGRVSLKVHHPNLPVAHRLGEADGRAFLVLEYIHGHSLIQVLRAVITARRGLGVASTIAIGRAAAHALAHLHALADLDGAPLEVIHRDVSPHNLIIGSDGVVKLIDLGVARAALQTHHTETGVVKGKYAYMAPEQLGPASRLDARADLFSLGIVLHELLLGRALFQGTSDLDTCDRVRLLPIPDLVPLRPDLPRAVADVVMTALERNPDRRWQSGAQLAAALDVAAQDSGVWPSDAGLVDEVVALIGPAPRPVLDRGVLTWRDLTPSPPPITWSAARTGQGTVLRHSSPRPHTPTPPTPMIPSIPELSRTPYVAPDPVPDPVDEELSDAIDARKTPVLPPDPDPPRRDPALSYYIHVGAVPPRDDEKK